MNNYLKAFALACSLTGYQMSAAVSVTTWIDDQGVRHFSQFPPPPGEQAVETLELYTPPTPPDGSQSSQDRIQTILDVARELELSRQQREQFRLDQASRLGPPLPPDQTATEPDTIFLNPPYGRYSPPHHHPPGDYPHWGNKPPRPERPDIPKPSPPRSRIVTPDAEETPVDSR